MKVGQVAGPLVRSFKIKEQKPFSFYYYFLRLMGNHLLPMEELLLPI
jgi:hypothetical protein